MGRLELWKCGRAVECTGFKIRQTLPGLVGSNPTTSATAAPSVVYLARTPALQAGKTGSYPVRGTAS